MSVNTVVHSTMLKSLTGKGRHSATTNGTSDSKAGDGSESWVTVRGTGHDERILSGHFLNHAGNTSLGPAVEGERERPYYGDAQDWGQNALVPSAYDIAEYATLRYTHRAKMFLFLLCGMLP